MIDNNEQVLIIAFCLLVFDEKNLDIDGLETALKAVHSDGETVVPGKLPFKKSHIRSSSCDVKFMRDYDAGDSKYIKVPKKSHSRTSSDMEQEFRRRFSSHQNRNNSDHLNIKCIINYLKSGPKLNEETTTSDRASSAGSRRGHSRNHSYDRIYTAISNGAFLPDYLEERQAMAGEEADVAQECEQHEKDVNVRWAAEMCNKNKFLEMTTPAAAAIELLVPASFESKYTHSRNNSKDFNVKLDEFAGLGGVGAAAAANLRHRRTNSKDLNVVAGGSHRRNSSQQRLQIEGDEEAPPPGQSMLHFNSKNSSNSSGERLE